MEPSSPTLLLDDLDQVLSSHMTKDPVRNIEVLVKCISFLQSKKHSVSKSLYENHGRRWTSDENKEILSMFRDSEDMNTMVQKLKRSPRSIQYQMSRLLLQDTRNIDIADAAVKYNKTPEQIMRAMDTLHHIP
jgi:hypothetical protein